MSGPVPAGPVAAFFDLDLTLISVNSGKLWVQRERRRGRLNARQMLDAAVLIGMYHLGVIDMDAAVRKALDLYRGWPEQRLEQMTRQWYAEEVAHTVAPGAWAVLQTHRAAGQPRILLTSSSPYMSRVVCEHLDLDGFLCTTYEVKDGVFTGAPVLPLCYAEGKVQLAEALARERGYDLNRSYFYSDSYTDVPMLERVGQPRVVNPDLRLRWHARKRGWPVLDWQGRPGR